jgi:hypothetical protein
MEVIKMAVRATGTVSRLVIRGSRTQVRLDIEDGPKDGYFNLSLDDPNHGKYYNALYSMALAAAVNRLPLTIRTQAEITSAEEATVREMIVDW